MRVSPPFRSKALIVSVTMANPLKIRRRLAQSSFRKWLLRSFSNHVSPDPNTHYRRALIETLEARQLLTAGLDPVIFIPGFGAPLRKMNRSRSSRNGIPTVELSP